MATTYEIEQDAIDAFLARPETKTEDHLKSFLRECIAEPGKWQILSAHSTLNAARTKVAKIRQGYMASTIKVKIEDGSAQIGVSNNATVGPVVVVCWKGDEA